MDYELIGVVTRSPSKISTKQKFVLKCSSCDIDCSRRIFLNSLSFFEQSFVSTILGIIAKNHMIDIVEEVSPDFSHTYL